MTQNFKEACFYSAIEANDLLLSILYSISLPFVLNVRLFPWKNDYFWVGCYDLNGRACTFIDMVFFFFMFTKAV